MEERRSPFERAAINTLQTTIAGLLIWVGTTATNIRDSVIELKVQYAQMRGELTQVREDVAKLRGASPHDMSRPGVPLRSLERRVGNDPRP